MVDHLVSHRRDDIPGVRTASSPGAVRTTMDRDSRCSFLVGAATQFFPSDSRLALRGMAFPGIFPGSNRIPAGLFLDPPIAATDCGALAYGHPWGSDNGEILAGWSVPKDVQDKSPRTPVRQSYRFDPNRKSSSRKPGCCWVKRRYRISLEPACARIILVASSFSCGDQRRRLGISASTSDQFSKARRSAEFQRDKLTANARLTSARDARRMRALSPSNPRAMRRFTRSPGLRVEELSQAQCSLSGNS